MDNIEFIKSQYAKYVKNMEPREFGELMIRKGGMRFRIEILERIEELGYIKFPNTFLVL